MALTVRNLGVRDYVPTWQAMRHFTDARQPGTASELWLVEHPPVFTQGQAGKPEHLLNTGNIPVVQTDRGGQITYHGPGQLVIYLLLDLRDIGRGIRQIVTLLEGSVIALLAAHRVKATARADAPGVYVEGQKVASLGLRVRRGCTYHGLAVNVDMDLEPFSRIHPCGYEGMEVTQLKSLGIMLSVADVGKAIVPHLCRCLGLSWRNGNDPIPTIASDRQKG